MSWLEEQRTRGIRPFPVERLAVRVGLDPGDRELTGKLALRLGMDRGWVRRCRALGLTEDQADVWAAKLGFTLGEVWPAWWTGLRGIALVNANRLTCRSGHPLDTVDSAGWRRCSTCRRAQWRQAKKSRKILVSGLVDATRQQRALPAVFDAGMAQMHGSRERLVALLPPDLVALDR